MKTICGANCDNCGFRESCKGCAATCGQPDTGFILICRYGVNRSDPELLLYRKRWKPGDLS